MTAIRTLSLGLAAPAFSTALACSCFGPTTFCGTLNPPFPNPEWWIPESVVLGVKLSDFQHGMDVKVIQSFSGGLQPDDTVRVWGDCGSLCRYYPTTWAVGDTVVWAFMITDLAGNSMCGTSYEQPTDHMISICGVYYLDYSSGMVSGPITTETPETMTINQFAELVIDCLSMGSTENSVPNTITVVPGEGGPWISSTRPDRYALSVMDATGRLCISRAWDGTHLQLAHLRSGTYLLRVDSDEGPIIRRFVVP